MSFETELKLALYRHTAEVSTPPSVAEMASATGRSEGEVVSAYRRLEADRVLVLEEDEVSIRMAPPFSGVETQHRVSVAGREYFANCAWDALGVVAALGADGMVSSRCEQSFEPIRLEVRDGTVGGSPCVVHYAVPAAHWWDDIVHT